MVRQVAIPRRHCSRALALFPALNLFLAGLSTLNSRLLRSEAAGQVAWTTDRPGPTGPHSPTSVAEEITKGRKSENAKKDRETAGRSSVCRTRTSGPALEPRRILMIAPLSVLPTFLLRPSPRCCFAFSVAFRGSFDLAILGREVCFRRRMVGCSPSWIFPKGVRYPRGRSLHEGLARGPGVIEVGSFNPSGSHVPCRFSEGNSLCLSRVAELPMRPLTSRPWLPRNRTRRRAGKTRNEI
jgi:hypothetical protein